MQFSYLGIFVKHMDHSINGLNSSMHAHEPLLRLCCWPPELLAEGGSSSSSFRLVRHQSLFRRSENNAPPSCPPLTCLGFPLTERRCDGRVLDRCKPGSRVTCSGSSSRLRPALDRLRSRCCWCPALAGRPLVDALCPADSKVP
jgi:hypothetical protein